MATAIELRGVGKRFQLRNKNIRTWKDRLVHLGRAHPEEFWALKEIDLVVPEGSTTAILGHNGSGKSTLLKCVAGILRPTDGSVRTRGRTAALMELGAGFHPDLTGRENVYLNGSILGLARSEIDDRFDDIISFAELEPFIDSQVKNYSSGMHARLGFAVAAHVEPDILLIDEVLAVGDDAFQRKCLDRIHEFQREGRTILLVTHDLDIVRRICDEAAVLEHGELVCHDRPGQAVRVLRESLLRSGIRHPTRGREDVSTGGVGVTGVDIRYSAHERPYLLPGEPLELAIGFQAPHGLDDLVIGIEIHDQRGNLIHGTNTQLLGTDLAERSGRDVVVFAFEEVWLLEGVFFVTVGMHSRDGGTVYDWRTQEDFFEVMNTGRNLGLVDLRSHARLTDDPIEQSRS